MKPLSDDAIGLCKAYDARLYAYFTNNYFDEGDCINENEFLKSCDYVMHQLSAIGRAMRREREGRSYDKASAHILAPRCLALCFTGNGDLLSQWRGYGDDGRGVAVGFRRSDINAFLDWWSRFELVTEGKYRQLRHDAVYYRDKDDSFATVTTEEMRHRRFMDERWELTRGSMLRRDEISKCDMSIYTMLHRYLGNRIPADDIMTRRRENEFVFDICKHTAPLFKQQQFYEEEEERLFIWIEGGQKVEGLERYIPQDAGRPVSKDGMLVSYLDITALKHEKRCTSVLGPAPIVSVGRVVIGPRCRASEHDIAALFSDYKIVPNIDQSRIPYVG